MKRVCSISLGLLLLLLLSSQPGCSGGNEEPKVVPSLKSRLVAPDPKMIPKGKALMK